MKVALPILDARIDARVATTRAAHRFWPCAAGCSDCCRSLPTLPTITRPEWERLSEAIASLAPDAQEAIRERTRVEGSRAAPITCPLLDRERGTCLVYEARPIACRTYGYYTERDAGLHCAKVSVAIEAHDAADDVVWGNGEAIADDLRRHGALRALDAWMEG